MDISRGVPIVYIARSPLDFLISRRNLGSRTKWLGKKREPERHPTAFRWLIAKLLELLHKSKGVTVVLHQAIDVQLEKRS